jgi:hypothetical protein
MWKSVPSYKFRKAATGKNRAVTPLGNQVAQQGRSAADRGQHRQAAGFVEKDIKASKLTDAML